MTLFDTISKDIMAAMKAKDKIRLDTLRNIKKAFIVAKTAPGQDGELSDAEAAKILQKLAKQGKESAQTYQEQNRPELAQEELAQVNVILEYMPKQMDEAEIKKIIEEIIQKTNAEGLKDLGKVMGQATAALAGKAEGSTIAQIAKSLLS